MVGAVGNITYEWIHALQGLFDVRMFGMPCLFLGIILLAFGLASIGEGMSVVGGWMVVAPFVFGTSFAKNIIKLFGIPYTPPPARPHAAPAPVPKTQPVHHVAHAAHVPWIWLLFVFAIVVVAAAAAGVVVKTAHLIGASREKKREALALRTQWANSRDAVSLVRETYGDYMMDISKLWEFPLVGSKTDTAAVAFHAAWRKLERYETEAVPADRKTLESYVEAADTMVAEWDDLEEKAKQLRRSVVPTEYRDAVEKAVDLLKQGLDGGVTAAERKSFVDRAMAEAEKANQASGAVVLPVPEKARQALEASHALALEPVAHEKVAA